MISFPCVPEPIPLSRYITVATVSNTETKLAFQLLSYLTGIINTNTTCSACLDTFNASVQVRGNPYLNNRSTRLLPNRHTM